MKRPQSLFVALIGIQALHSFEEYAGRLWETFPPAQALTGLVSADRAFGFLVINIGLVAFGMLCLWPVLAGWRGARGLMWFWVVIELINGVGHPAWSTIQGGYTPGLATSVPLLVLAVLLARELRSSAAQR